MKKPILLYYSLYFLLTLSVLTFYSCDKDDPTIDMDISGEWLEDASSDDMTMMYVSNYSKGGTMKNLYVEVHMNQNRVEDEIGTYTVKDSELTLKFQDPVTNQNTVQEYTIRELTDYKMVLYNKSIGSTTTAYRIISTYNMNVGETKQIILSDEDFIPSSYRSNIKKVATVDASGTITAVKRGTAYMIVSSAETSVVIRVNVTDPSNLFDDYSNYLGIQKESIINSFGNGYHDLTNELGESFLHYYIYDEYFSAVQFFYKTKSYGWWRPTGLGGPGFGWYERYKRYPVLDIYVDVRESVNTSDISKELNRKFQYLDTNENGGEIYGTIRVVFPSFEEEEIYVQWYPKERFLKYSLIDNTGDLINILNKLEQ